MPRPFRAEQLVGRGPKEMDPSRPCGSPRLTRGPSSKADDGNACILWRGANAECSEDPAIVRLWPVYGRDRLGRAIDGSCVPADGDTGPMAPPC